jgi:hypothetical protein
MRLFQGQLFSPEGGVLEQSAIEEGSTTSGRADNKDRI